MNKYRYKDIIGNSTAVSLLRRASANNTLDNVVFFTGPSGTGKTTSANTTALFLTCDNPIDEEPCLKCPSCISTMKALESGGQSRHVKSINAGKISDKKDVNDLIKEIFMLESTQGNNVYIINEFQCFKEINGSKSLGETAQMIFLDEIDKMPSNTYIFITTSDADCIIPGLINRGTEFRYGRLNNKESNLLLERTCAELKVKIESKHLRDMIITNSKGIPRKLVKSVDFVSKNNVIEDEYKEFLGLVTTSSFLSLFEAMKDTNMLEFTTNYDYICDSKKDTGIVADMKQFLLDTVLFLESGYSDVFSRTEKDSINSLFQNTSIYRVAEVVFQLPNNANKDELFYALMKVRRLIQNRTVTEVISSKTQVARADKIAISERQSEVSTLTSMTSSNGAARKIDSTFMESFNKKGD